MASHPVGLALDLQTQCQLSLYIVVPGWWSHKHEVSEVSLHKDIGMVVELAQGGQDLQTECQVNVHQDVDLQIQCKVGLHIAVAVDLQTRCKPGWWSHKREVSHTSPFPHSAQVGQQPLLRHQASQGQNTRKTKLKMHYPSN